MSEPWYWVLVFAAVGTSFLIGRWCGIRDFEKAWERAKFECQHGIDSRDEICLECEVLRVQKKHEDSQKAR